MQTEENTSRINLPRLTKRILLTLSIVALVLVVSRPVFAATTAPTLGSAATFAVLGASTVTNTGLTTITGDLGVSPGTACTGLPTPCTGNGPGVVTGTIHAGDAVAAQAHTDLVTAYNALKAMQCGTNLTGKVLGTDVTSLSSGVYCFDTTAQLTGTLHLSGTVVFQLGTALTTASNSFVIVDDNGGCGGNVFWEIGSAATLGTGTTFAGNILANTAITITTGATISGRALDVTAAVTMDTNHIAACGAGAGTGGNCTSDDNSAAACCHTDDNEGRHVAKGDDKQDKPDTSLMVRVQSFMAALGTHNPQHTATHSTETHHDSEHGHNSHAGDNDREDTDACTNNKDNDDNHHQGNHDHEGNRE